MVSVGTARLRCSCAKAAVDTMSPVGLTGRQQNLEETGGGQIRVGGSGLLQKLCLSLSICADNSYRVNP